MLNGYPFSLHTLMVLIIIHAAHQHFNTAEHYTQALQTDKAHVAAPRSVHDAYAGDTPGTATGAARAQVAGTPHIASVIRDLPSKSAIASRSMAMNFRTHDSTEYS